jgi:hypothetical protein
MDSDLQSPQPIGNQVADAEARPFPLVMSVPLEIWLALFPTPPRLQKHYSSATDTSALLFFRVYSAELQYTIAVEYGCVHRYWSNEVRFRNITHAAWDEEFFRGRFRNFLLFGLICRSTYRLTRRFLAEAFMYDCIALSDELWGRYALVDSNAILGIFSFADLISVLYTKLGVFITEGLRETGYLEGEDLNRGEGKDVGICDGVIDSMMHRCHPMGAVDILLLLLKHDHFQPV